MCNMTNKIRLRVVHCDVLQLFNPFFYLWPFKYIIYIHFSSVAVVLTLAATISIFRGLWASEQIIFITPNILFSFTNIKGTFRRFLKLL